MTELLGMGAGAAVGKSFATLTKLLDSQSDARKEAHSMAMQAMGAEEKSRERANEVNGGVWLRRAVYFLVAFLFVSASLAAWFGLPVVIENEVTKGILFWKKTVIEYTQITGVPLLRVYSTAFTTIVGFVYGSKT